MKMIKTVLAFVCVSALTLTSCSSDDDSGISTDADISGKWNYNRTVTNLNGQESNQNYNTHEAGCDKDYVQFADGNVFRDVVLYRNPANVCTEDAIVGTWAKSGNTLTITTPSPEPGQGNVTENFQIIRLDGSELHYVSTTSTGGSTLTVTQVFTRN
ncbi:MAG: lipocalin family protein [Flavobacterium sp.]|nr:lipocalin family protein [Flavobacterium sp.]